MAAEDIVLICVLLFAVGIGIFVIHLVISNSYTSMISVAAINESNATVSAFGGLPILASRLDYLFFGLFIGLIFGLIITGWFIGGHPIFMLFYFLIIVITVCIAPILSNAWETFSQASVFGTTVAAFPITNHILLMLPLYIAVIGFIGVVVMFAKPAGGQYG